VERLHAGALILAVITTGLMAGVFQFYSHTVMPGLARTDDRTFVGAFQSLDRAILNPLFLLTFLGAFGLTALAAGFSLRSRFHSMLPWLLVALGLYLVVLVITFAVNVPLNNALKAAGRPENGTELAAIRQAFGEGYWVRWNTVRAVASTVAFGSLTWALVLYGRVTG